jgi:hypothetical protein
VEKLPKMIGCWADLQLRGKKQKKLEYLLAHFTIFAEVLGMHRISAKSVALLLTENQ